MRFYTFIIIIVGIMILFNIAGIDTPSARVVDALSGTGSWTDWTIWAALLIAISASIGLAGARISVLGVGWQGSMEAVVGAFVSVTLTFFVSDFLSILTKVGETTCTKYLLDGHCAGLAYHTWEYYVIFMLIIPISAGVIYTVIDYIRGTD